MAAASFSDMPQEILDEIVDHGARNAGLLRACALVCHSLRERAQSHLFVQIKILTTERIFQLINLIHDNPTISKHLEMVHVSSRQFIPVHGINTALASLLLVVKKLSPHSSLCLMVFSHASDTEHQPRPMNHISRELLLYSMSIVTGLQLHNLTDFPAAALFNFRCLDYVGWNKTTIRPSIGTIMGPHHMSTLPPFFFRNITRLEIFNIDDFPAILVMNCHALATLSLVNMSFSGPGATPASSLPRVEDLNVSAYTFAMIETLVDRVVDLSRLLKLRDAMKLEFEYEDEQEEDEEIVQCHRHLLSKSKYSLKTLQVLCLLRNYSSIVSTIPCPLSDIPNLEMLHVEFDCLDDSDERNSSLYLHDLLNTIDTETTRIKSLTIQFNLVLKPISTDERGQVHLSFLVLPLLLSHGPWADIGRSFLALANKSCTQFRMTISYSNPDESDNYEYDGGSLTDATDTVSDMIDEWAQEFLIPDGLVRHGQTLVIAIQQV
ncbi:hypothetical protein HYPSUDRAFT_67062 [Hypholoma sublateritium FD-334 SS-4]|uniref:F-box domain-containing protein n=1 Tax=Hypholoma sublateritium (strain FD-334 SS-4) TaxID=945553 RepID=A0A0D2P0W6_HYPSF|nr:hypothetical protein HYPSUDRAFT_67062 [Hypholoma sublateritium FD-334 SS-4]